MSQSQAASSTGRTALAIGVVALIIGASALGYAVYFGLSQLPSQLSSVSVDKPCSTAQPCANKTSESIGSCPTRLAKIDSTPRTLPFSKEITSPSSSSPTTLQTLTLSPSIWD